MAAWTRAASLVFPIDVPKQSGAYKLVWKDGYELHVAIATAPLDDCPGPAHATVDLGEIHQAAVTTTNTGAALVVSGRGIHSLKRRHNRALGQIAKKRHRCQKGSRRYWRLQAARQKASDRKRRQIRDLRHKGTRAVIAFCRTAGVGSLFIGNPQGVRNHRCGRHHNQRLSQWEYGRDIAYLTYKAKLAHIESFTGSERGTSSRCPVCGWKQKVRGRVWRCRRPQCAFVGHRDVVGSFNMHPPRIWPHHRRSRGRSRINGPVPSGSVPGINSRGWCSHAAGTLQSPGHGPPAARWRCLGESYPQPPLR
ncbi:MAG: zinc ribbon domain-containing protein [Ktedonobacterales bacterium]